MTPDRCAEVWKEVWGDQRLGYDEEVFDLENDDSDTAGSAAGERSSGQACRPDASTGRLPFDL